MYCRSGVVSDCHRFHKLQSCAGSCMICHGPVGALNLSIMINKGRLAIEGTTW
jgi:hypothetical protein